MVRLQTQSIIQALFESGGRIAREPVDQVQPEDGAGLVQQGYLLGELNCVDLSVDIGKHCGMSALKPDL